MRRHRNTRRGVYVTQGYRSSRRDSRSTKWHAVQWTGFTSFWAIWSVNVNPATGVTDKDGNSYFQVITCAFVASSRNIKLYNYQMLLDSLVWNRYLIRGIDVTFTPRIGVNQSSFSRGGHLQQPLGHAFSTIHNPVQQMLVHDYVSRPLQLHHWQHRNRRQHQEQEVRPDTVRLQRRLRNSLVQNGRLL